MRQGEGERQEEKGVQAAVDGVEDDGQTSFT